MTRCARCHDDVDAIWATIEMWSRVGNHRALDLCQSCTTLAYAFVLNRPLHKEEPMTIIWSTPLNDPDDIDDAEHSAMCHCAECDPDFRFELQREERWEREAS